jgi:hypothetical protein
MITVVADNYRLGRRYLEKNHGIDHEINRRVSKHGTHVLGIDILKELFLDHQRTREGCVLLLPHNLPFYRVPTV